MASPFQQQALRRKVTYLGLILVLFTFAFLWRTLAVAELSHRLALREVDLGEVELNGSVVRLVLTGSRGFATCALWLSAIEKQKRNQWNETELLVRSVTKLQPNFIRPWLFQSWNLAYNVYAQVDRVNDKYFYFSRGVDLLAEGERQNRDNPDIRFWTGFYVQHKVCKSDETNVQRSLFQLSLIPPNERDPSRFKQVNPATNKEEINLAEFEDFCKKHPQLVRRLHQGIMRDTLGEARRQFTCASAADAVRFLADNLRVPSPYQERTPAPVGLWKVEDDKLRPLADRFPALPPRRNPAPPQHLFDPREWTAEDVTRMGDDVDGFAVARAWFAYAQEPIPDPGELPGSTQEITDRGRQRKPKQITTLIFRNSPALAQSGSADRLQQEGWFDNEPFLVTNWFGKDDRFADGTPSHVGDTGVKWSQAAWEDANERWLRHGKENHLWLEPADAKNMEQLAEEFINKYSIEGRPPELRVEGLSEHDRAGYRAAHYLWENRFYRGMSNFDYQLMRSGVEADEDTVAGRKALYQAERLRWEGSVVRALDKYAAALPFWRDKVLLKKENVNFRRDSTVQEDAYDWQYRYLRLYHEQNGVLLKRRLGEVARFVPLAPKVDPATFEGWILKGPLDVDDEEGFPLITAQARHTVNARKPPMPGRKAEGGPKPPPAAAKAG